MYVVYYVLLTLAVAIMVLWRAAGLAMIETILEYRKREKDRGN